MTSDSREVLSALLDREPVDPDQLSNVLNDADARAVLVDFVRLRQLLAEPDDERLASRVVGPSYRSSARSLWRIAAAVLVLAGAATGGFWAGEQAAEERPPAPDRVVEFKQGVDWSDNSVGSTMKQAR